MRVIAGTARRLKLKTLKGMDTRPTQDIIKETLFNMIQAEIPGCRFLDLYAGSGAIGIEALSRGASEAVFVENNRDAANVIYDNLEFTRLKEGARVICADAAAALGRLENGGRFDVIHMDPPYGQGHEKRILNYLISSALADSETLIVIETLKDINLDYLERTGYVIIKDKPYKNNRHVFIRKG